VIRQYRKIPRRGRKRKRHDPGKFPRIIGLSYDKRKSVHKGMKSILPLL